MAPPTFLWHDYETFGADPRRDRPAQFGALRTDWNLEPIGEPLVVHCQPALDTLPSPDACLITGITPQQCARDGLSEAGFAAAVHEVMAEPGTCSVGYNSIRFDDEFTRHLLYRNFHDPYAREWSEGNSRWDLIDLARLACALRPQGMEWPLRPDGAPSFRLGDLTAANGIAHGHAHDALSDVEATLGLARRLRAAQPRLFDFYLSLRDRKRALAMLDWRGMTPLVHVSSRYPAQRHCLAVVAPVAPVPGRPNEVVVYDLAEDPEPFLALDTDELRDRLYTPRADLPEGVARLPLKTVKANHSPALAPLSVLDGVDLARLGVDLDRVQRHVARLRACAGLSARLGALYEPAAEAPPTDVELALYASFVPNVDKPLLQEVRAAPPARLAALSARFHDARYPELLFRYRARNWPQTLSVAEQARWRQLRRDRLQGRSPAVALGLDAYNSRIHELRATATAAQHAILDALESWGRQLGEDLDP